MDRYDAERECGEHIEMTLVAVGLSSFIVLAQFDGLALNAGAGRLLGLDEAQAQWLGASELPKASKPIAAGQPAAYGGTCRPANYRLGHQTYPSGTCQRL